MGIRSLFRLATACMMLVVGAFGAIGSMFREVSGSPPTPEWTTHLSKIRDRAAPYAIFTGLKRAQALMEDRVKAAARVRHENRWNYWEHASPVSLGPPGVEVLIDSMNQFPLNATAGVHEMGIDQGISSSAYEPKATCGPSSEKIKDDPALNDIHAFHGDGNPVLIQ